MDRLYVRGTGNKTSKIAEIMFFGRRLAYGFNADQNGCACGVGETDVAASDWIDVKLWKTLLTHPSQVAYQWQWQQTSMLLPQQALWCEQAGGLHLRLEPRRFGGWHDLPTAFLNPWMPPPPGPRKEEAKGLRRAGEGLAGFLAPSNFAIPEAPV